MAGYRTGLNCSTGVLVHNAESVRRHESATKRLETLCAFKDVLQGHLPKGFEIHSLRCGTGMHRDMRACCSRRLNPFN